LQPPETALNTSDAGSQAWEEQFSAAVEGFGEAFIALNFAGRITYINQKGEQLLGRQRQTLIGQALESAFAPETAIEISARCQQAIATQTPQEFILSSLGALPDLSLRLQPTRTGLFIYFQAVDLPLSQSEAELSSLFQTIPNGILILDPAGNIVSANAAAEQILRLSSSNLRQRTYNDLLWSITTVTGDAFPEESLPFVQVMRTGRPVYGVEHAVHYEDGTRVVLSVNASPLLNAEGRIVGVIAALSDITERVRIEAERQAAEQALRESEEQCRSVIEAAAEGIVLQYADGRIYTCNTSAERILGLTAEQITGRTSLDPRWRAIHEDGSSFPGELHPAMMTLKTGEPQSNVTMGIHKPDGSLNWISISTRPLFQPQEALPYAVVVSFFEVTDRKQREEERVQLAQEQSARKMAESAQQQSAFLAEVSSMLASSLEYEQTLQSVATLAVPYFADWCSVDLLNDDCSISRVAVAHSDPEKVKWGWEMSRRYPRHLEDGYGISEVMRTGRSELFSEITDEQLAMIPDPEYLRTISNLGLKSCIMSPLRVRDRVLGSISFVYSESGRRYSRQNLPLAEDLARRAAIAIDNARLFQRTQKAQQAAEAAASRIARLQAVTAALSESLTPLEVVEVMIDQSTAALGADSALIALVSADQRNLEIVKAVGYQPDLVESWRRFSIEAPVPLAEAVRTGQPLWLETPAQRTARYPHLADVYERYTFKSWMSLPLVAEGKAVGGILLSFQNFQQFSQDDRDFVMALSRQCAQAIFRAQLYEAERQAKTEAEQANQIKDEFLAVLSHELRSPLNPILGWAGLLRQGRLDAAKTAHAIETIERNAKLQVQLIEDLLDVSRILRGKLNLTVVPVDLAVCVQSALETVRLAAEAKGIEVRSAEGEAWSRIGKSAAEFRVLGDAARLQQVVWNLLSNAIKFTPAGGQVDVSLARVGAQVQLQVSDTGKGITSDFLPHVFDYFRQADSSTTRAFGGLGLGLAIVQHLVELHGGTVAVQSPGEDQGATFTVMLPLYTARSESPDPVPILPLQPAAAPLTGLHILLVDDDSDTREVIGLILKQAGARITEAASAAAALEAFSQARFDLLISDIGMPDQNGYQLIQKIRAVPAALGGDVAAIALTAYAGEINRDQALAAGFQQHLAKPIEPDQLIESVVNLIRCFAAEAAKQRLEG
jgi:PAS domain S-box-containing protein